jgi:hypothetical protein
MAAPTTGAVATLANNWRRVRPDRFDRFKATWNSADCIPFVWAARIAGRRVGDK